MKNWKAVFAGIFILCLSVLIPFAFVFAEDGAVQEEETEEPIPDSYYYPIESNEIKNWPQGPAIEAASAAVLDIDTGAFLYSKNAEATQYPASTTKVMTALLLLENCNLDEEITFSNIVYDLEEGSSHIGIQPGETMTLRDAVYGLMLESANDVANGIAEYMGGSIGGFADMMNARAAELGCTNTHFSNPHGLYSDDHYTCARDLAIIAAAAYRNEDFRKVVCAKEHTIPVTNLTEEERYCYNHQKMMHSDEEYYWQYCTGGKTGFTSQCLNTLVTYAEKDGRRLVSVILRVNGAGKAYNESRSILEYGFDNFSAVNYKRSSPASSFYDIMGLSCLGAASEFQSDVWRRKPFADCSVNITIPNTVSPDQLSCQVTQESGNSRSVSYQYEGTSVGTSSGTFYPVYAPAQLVFERRTEMAAVQVSQSGNEPDSNIQIENLNDVLARTTMIFKSGYLLLKDYALSHTMTVVVAGAVLLLILLIFIIILIFRCTSDYRIRRRRRQEEKERLRREEEIERMTTAEIEAELRAVMQEEQQRREQELRAQAEAERAAEEARKMEEEAHETERLLQELEEERQKR